LFACPAIDAGAAKIIDLRFFYSPFCENYDFTHTYNDNNLPLTKTADFTITTGTNA
jgi:hypothetical protein